MDAPETLNLGTIEQLDKPGITPLQVDGNVVV
jgi:hypothetical protein